MQPEELKQLKEEMRTIFVEEIRKIDWKKILKPLVVEIMKDEGMTWG